ncbi:MAG TPA: helix-hairpin-helix domain-containing protein, partial [Patescibacteria group bacterium]|nr:helix-hairpin-helix domain-containing protein [Patescibacteria group bacterium]
PFLSKFTIAKALKYLRRVFPYSTHTPTNIPKRACLQAQIGLCPGLEADMTTLKDYRKNLSMLVQYMTGKRKSLIKDIEKQMNIEAKNKNFEAAASLRNKLFALKRLDSRIIFGDRENMDISKDHGLIELSQLLEIKPPRRIEGFDISHMQGTDTVASMVVFQSGVPDKSEYRKFKSRIKGNDDFAHMREVISRRLSPFNLKKWGKPDLLLIDGGKGQVSSAKAAMEEAGMNIPIIGLAKRYEEIIVPKEKSFEIIRLQPSSDALKLLQRIRDESHRFAVSYHSTLKRSRQTTSILDGIPGIGEVYKKRLIRQFGSSKSVQNASLDELKSVVGEKRARLIKELAG